MKSRLVLERYSEILKELREILPTLPIYKFGNEIDPVDISLHWKEIQSNDRIEVPDIKIDKLEIPNESRNVICKLCPDRIAGIRGFLQKGTQKILILHYTGEISSNKKPYSKPGKNQIFRETKEEEIFDRMIRKVFGFGMREFYYQEFPGCNFNSKSSTKDDWFKRTSTCLTHVAKTVREEKIQGIIITGRAAVSFFGIEKAESLLDNIFNLELENMKVLTMVIRSPEKLLNLEENKNKYDKIKHKNEYENALSEEKIIKNQVVNNLVKFKDKVLT